MVKAKCSNCDEIIESSYSSNITYCYCKQSFIDTRNKNIKIGGSATILFDYVDANDIKKIKEYRRQRRKKFTFLNED